MQSGKLLLEALGPPEYYVFIEYSDNPGFFYERGGKICTEQEIEALHGRITKLNRTEDRVTIIQVIVDANR